MPMCSPSILIIFNSDFQSSQVCLLPSSDIKTKIYAYYAYICAALIVPFLAVVMYRLSAFNFDDTLALRIALRITMTVALLTVFLSYILLPNIFSAPLHYDISCLTTISLLTILHMSQVGLPLYKSYTHEKQLIQQQLNIDKQYNNTTYNNIKTNTKKLLLIDTNTNTNTNTHARNHTEPNLLSPKSVEPIIVNISPALDNSHLKNNNNYNHSLLSPASSLLSAPISSPSASASVEDNISLASILHDVDGKLKFFEKFVIAEFALENPLFYTRVHFWRSRLSVNDDVDTNLSIHDERVIDALEIYNNFICTNSAYEINISSACKLQIHKFFKPIISTNNNVNHLNIPLTNLNKLKNNNNNNNNVINNYIVSTISLHNLSVVYDEAVKEIYRLMDKDTFLRFKISPLYRQMIQQCERQDIDDQQHQV